MEHEAEAVGAASAGSLSSGAHFSMQSSELCANCWQVVPDRFYSTCGQLASEFRRPCWELIAGSLAGMFALDGRLLRSLPMLDAQPGRITRSCLTGERARDVPPFRMFLLASVIFFFTVFTLGDEFGRFDGCTLDPNPNDGFFA